MRLRQGDLIRSTSALLALVLLISCGSQVEQAPGDQTSVPSGTSTQSQPGSAVLGQPFTLKIGQSTMIASEALTVEFGSVGEDSRCPTKVNCTWMGRASVSVTMSQGDQPRATTTLITIHSPEKTDRATYGAYEIRLVGLTPRPEYPHQKVDLRDYVVELQVAKLPAP